MALEPLLTLKEAAEATRIDLWALRRAVKAKELPATKPRGIWYLRVSDVEAWLARGSNQKLAG